MVNNFSDLGVLFFSLSSFLFGWGLSHLNTLANHAILAFKWCDGNHFECTEATEHLRISLIVLFCGACVGSLFIGYILTFGRRPALAVTFLLYEIGGVVCALSIGKPIWMFYVGRLVAGGAIGFSTVTVPTYITEMTPVNVRGSRGVIHQLMITIGIFAGTAIGFAVSKIPVGSSGAYVLPDRDIIVVRLAMGLPAIIGILGHILQTTYFVYDTPTYYVGKDSVAEASRVLRKIYNKEDIEDELKQVVLTNEQSRALNQTGNSTLAILKSPFVAKYLLVILFACVLSAGQQLSGINVFVTLSARIFESCGMTPEWTTTASTIVAAVNTLMTFPAMTVDKFGRRSILLTMATGQTLFLLVYPIASFCTESVYILSIMSLISVLGFIMCFAVGYGPILWLYMVEIFPPEIRSQASAAASAVNWLSTIFIVSFGSGEYSSFTKFSVFGGMGIFFTLWIFLFMKESKGLYYSPYFPPKNGEIASSRFNEQEALLL